MTSGDDKTSLSVLVIEDNVDQRELLEILLQRDGYLVTTAENGMEALEKLAKKPAQIILSDIMMPKMDGFELIRRVRSHPDLKNIYLIFITARVLERERVQGLDLGADDYILKPFSPSELLARVRVGARVVQYQLHLEYQALRDPLTGLFNRRALEERIEEEFERTKRYHHSLYLLILDRQLLSH
jgi:PleD family two-component response regulator